MTNPAGNGGWRFDELRALFVFDADNPEHR